MALEFEKLIQQKVWLADAQPVAWSSERVWQQIELPNERKSRVPFFYLAASILLTGVFIYFFIQYRQQNIQNIRITQLESAVDCLTVDPVLSTADEPVNQVCKPSAQVFIAAKKKQVSPEMVDASSTITPEPISTSVNVESPVVVVQDEPSLIAPEESRPVIQAIIGIIPEKSVSRVFGRKKIKRLRPSKDSESNPELFAGSQSTEGQSFKIRIN